MSAGLPRARWCRPVGWKASGAGRELGTSAWAGHQTELIVEVALGEFKSETDEKVYARRAEVDGKEERRGGTVCVCTARQSLAGEEVVGRGSGAVEQGGDWRSGGRDWVREQRQRRRGLRRAGKRRRGRVEEGVCGAGVEEAERRLRRREEVEAGGVAVDC